MPDVNWTEQDWLCGSGDEVEPDLPQIVAMFSEQATRLRTRPTFEALLECCSASRYTWARLYMDYLFTGVFYPDLTARFSADLQGVIAAVDEIKRVSTSEQAALACRYARSIALRHRLLLILTRDGARAVERELDRLAA